MMIAYFDCFSGISGDMCLGALVDAGVSLKDIERQLKKLPIKGYSLIDKKVRRAGLSATKVDVIQRISSRNQAPKRKQFKDIKAIIKAARLPHNTKQKGIDIFTVLFEAESRVHGEPLNKVHLHELAGVDCIIDVFGTLIGLELLGVKKIYASPINLGTGSVQTAHGNLPVPAPATLEIVKHTPVYSSNSDSELTTPTGAAILKSLSSGFGEMPVMIPQRIGMGAGDRDHAHVPNVIRMMVGEMYKKTGDQTVTVLETNIDDMNPQIYEYLVALLFKKGALDVYLTQVIMKKGRPGVKLTVICDNNMRDYLLNVLLKETTTIGVRYYETSRVVMERDFRRIDTKHGTIKLKISQYGNAVSKSTPEYEDCKRIASQKEIPLLEVFEAVRNIRKNKTRKKS